MFLKNNISLFALLIFLPCFMQASQQRALVPIEGAWDKLRDNTFAVTNTATGLLIVQDLVNGNVGPYASKAFLAYVIPCFLLQKYQSNINHGRPNLAEQITVGVSAAWCGYTLWKIVRPRPVTGRPVDQGYNN